MDLKMYQRNVDSEKIRNENEMRRLRQKLTNEHFKSKTVKQFKNLLKDNRNMMDYIYPVKISANNAATVLHTEQQANVALQKTHSGRRIEGSQKNVSVNDYNENSIHLNVKPEKNKDNIEKSDFQTKLKHAETKNDEKIVEEKKHNDIGIEEFTGVKRKTSISEIIDYNRLSPATEEQSSTKVTSRLTAHEASRIAYTLETWVNRLHLLQLMDGIENGETVNSVYGHEFDTYVEDGRTRVSKLRALESKILEQTYKELRLSETFVTLQQANHSMLKAMINEHKLDRELLSNRAKLNDLRDKEKGHKKRYNVRVIQVSGGVGVDERETCHDERQWLSKKYKETIELIKINDEYMWAWEDQWLNENKEIVDNEEKNHQNQIEIINKESIVNDNYIKEAKNIFLENMANIDRIMGTWEETYSKWESMIDLDILTLENEQEGLNDSCDELQVEIDELKTKI